MTSSKKRLKEKRSCYMKDNNSRDIVILNKIIKYADQINETIARFDLDFNKFENDYVMKNAIAMCPTTNRRTSRQTNRRIQNRTQPNAMARHHINKKQSRPQLWQHGHKNPLGHSNKRHPNIKKILPNHNHKNNRQQQ